MRTIWRTAATSLLLAATLTTPAMAANAIDGKRIKKNSITGRQIKSKAIGQRHLSATLARTLATRVPGPPGPAGPKGDPGGPGATYTAGAGLQLVGQEFSVGVPLWLTGSKLAVDEADRGSGAIVRGVNQADPHRNLEFAAGVAGEAANGVGVYGSGTYGVHGKGTSPFSVGVFGEAEGESAFGVIASVSGADSVGIHAHACCAPGSTAGRFMGPVEIHNISVSDPEALDVSTDRLNSNAVRARADGANSNAIYAVAEGTGSYAGSFDGNVNVGGTLTKNSGAFRIDHPLDPANQYLQHSFVESPDMKNIYDGVVRTDRRGFATVRMPEWFDALNRDFRYQLTVHGRTFARAIVWQELRDRRFVIRTSEPRVKVSWQVTGIREDAYAKANPIRNEVPKRGDEKGRYMHPELFGKPSNLKIR